MQKLSSWKNPLLWRRVNSVRGKLTCILDCNYIYIGEGKAPEGYIHYEEILSKGNPQEPDVIVDAQGYLDYYVYFGHNGKL